MMGDPEAREAAARAWIVLGQDRKDPLRPQRTPPSGLCAGACRRPIPPQAPGKRKSSAKLFLHRLAARTGLASTAQTRTQTDDEASGGASRDREEDDAGEAAGDEDHAADEAGRSGDEEDPDAPDADDAGKETLRMMTMKSTMQSPASLARRCQRDPSCSCKRQAKTPVINSYIFVLIICWCFD